MTDSATTMRRTVTDVGPEELRGWLERGEAELVDVREGFEYAAERIEGARHHPLSSFDPDALRAQCGDGRRVVFQCRTGRRSLSAAGMYRHGDEPMYHLAGGIEAWKRAGLPTERSATAPRIDILRQVQITAGALVVAGVLLGAFVSPWFLALSGFVGLGIFVAGATGWCGMAKTLAAMPWNRAG